MGVISDVWHAGGKLRHVFDMSIDEQQRRRDRFGAGVRAGVFIVWVLLVGASEGFGYNVLGGLVVSSSSDGSTAMEGSGELSSTLGCNDCVCEEEDTTSSSRHHLSGSFTESHVPAAS